MFLTLQDPDQDQDLSEAACCETVSEVLPLKVDGGHAVMLLMAEGHVHGRRKKGNTVPTGMGHPARPDLAALVPPFHP